MTGGLQIGTTKSFSSGVAAFDNLNWWIEPSQTPKVEVVITTNSAATLSGNDFLRFSLEASSVTAVDTEGNTVTATGIPANSAEAGGDTVVTVAGAGTLNATLAPNPTNPSSGLLVAGASDQVFVAFKYDAINDSFLVKKLNLLPYVGGASSIASNDRINVLKVRYKNQAGTTVTSTVGLSATTNQVDISANPMYVAQNGNATLEVLGDLAQFTVLDGTEDENLTFANDADNTSTLNQATGVGSNSDVNSWGAADLVGNQQNIYRTVLSAAKGSGTPENTGRSRSSAQFVASWRFTASTNSNAFLRGSKKGIDGATTSWAANGVGAPATSTTAVSGTSSISHTEDGTSAVNDSFNFDFGASAGLENYNRLNFNLRSVAAKAVGDMGISVSSTADSTDDATLNGLGTVTVNNVDLSATLAAATWANQDFAGPFVATDRFVTFNIKANPDNSNAVLVDDLRFYNDSITPTVAGSLGTAATIGGLLMELKNSGGTTVAYGGYTGTAATGTTVLIAGDGADKTAITTYSDVEFTSTGASYDLQTNTTTLMAADTTANETLSVSVATGAVSSAGNFRWYDNSDTAGSNNQAGITVVAPTSTTLDFSNNY
jgi:hypothetical protein